MLGQVRSMSVLHFEQVGNAIAFFGQSFLERRPTRYEGEPWEWIAVELACGIADPFTDVGLLVVAAEGAKILDLDRKAWVVVPDERADSVRSVACLSMGRWCYVPRSREGVEETVYQNKPFMKRAEEGLEMHAGSSIIAFPERTRFIEAVCSSAPKSQSQLDALLRDLTRKAYFELVWTPGAWNITPQTATTKCLMELALPVVERINASITEC